jgi:hypothetical protein
MTDFSADEIRRRYKSLPKSQRELVSQFIEQQTAIAAASSPDTDSRPANLTHRATGRLVLDDGADVSQLKPLHNATVELWDRDWGRDDYLGCAETDQNGFFDIWYDPLDAGAMDAPDFQIRVFDHEHVYHSDGKLELLKKLIYSFDGDDNVTREHYDFGQLAIPYWTYDPDRTLARIHVVEHGSPPQSFSHGRAVMLVKHAAQVELQRRLHHAEHMLHQHLPSLQHIQSSYPENLTLRLERERPGYTRSDEFFGERILNGMSASVMDKDPTNADRYWLHHHWTSYEQDDNYAAPNVDIWFELQHDRLMPVEIALQFRQRGHTEARAPLEAPMRFTPADGQKWLQAKRVARVSAALNTELDVHLAETHLNTEQYAIATYRNLRRSPLRYLLAPHLKEVILINRDAESRLLGEHAYIPQATALTRNAINERIVQKMGTLDWKNWRPRQIICPQHSYARGAHLFWGVLTEYIDWFFQQFNDEIRKSWYEVHRFSNDLVQHSAPFYLCPWLRGRLDKQGSLGDWFEPNERMDLSLPREVVDGIERAIQPVAHSDVYDADSADNMKQVCRYAIFHATFMHTWANSRQYDDGGELRYNSIGLRHGTHGVLSPEEDHSIMQPPDLATDQLWFAWMLSTSNYGFIVKNEDRDIHPQLIRLLIQKQAAFAEIGIDIKTIQSRINI